MKNRQLIFICGLCVIESEKMVLEVAKYLKRLTSNYPVDFYFKASFDKANRTSIDSFRGVGLNKGLDILRKVKEKVKCKILTDVHNVLQPVLVKDFADIIQIPAFMCRQTDLIIKIAQTNKIVNIKKGQFLAPEDMEYIITKIKSTGNDKIFLTERGTCFGYHNLVVDFRSFLTMKKFGYPVIFDATHSQQRPSETCQTGGNREFVIPMAKAAVACGVDGLFIETHPNPPKAKSDSATSLYLKDIKKLLEEISEIR
jgi:2-dehydro-3-deoxyphosphooctonate aldolase (KDO 8-P synthase)